jgi:hypothetical protein
MKCLFACEVCSFAVSTLHKPDILILRRHKSSGGIANLRVAGSALLAAGNNGRGLSQVPPAGLAETSYYLDLDLLD